MPRLVWIAMGIAALTAGCGRAPGPEELRLFVKAQDTFDQAVSRDDYLRAAAMYQEILDRGFHSGAVLYNQGNALMQAGQRGRAIAAYRQAMRYRARDPYLEANLRSALGGGSERARRSLVEYLLFWQDWLSYPEKFRLLAALAVLAAGLGLAAIALRRRRITQLALGCLSVALAIAVSAGYDWYRYDGLQHGVVTTAKLTARKGNSTSYQPALTAPLDEGTEFVVIERRGDWLLVRLPAGQEGWLEERGVVTY